MSVTLGELEKSAALVHASMPPTPQIVWPLLNQEVGAEVWVKHENHTATGAFKIRGGITFIDWLKREHPEVEGIITATRGNHGQSQARAATMAGLRSTIVVPKNNSREKNAAMQAFGAELIEFGADFDAARSEARRLAEEQHLYMVPAFHLEIVKGVASYAMELFAAAPDLDTVYVPIGCGSGICGTILARDALGLSTKIVGVVSTGAPAAKQSFDTGLLTETSSASTFADGVAVRVPVLEAFRIYSEGADRIVAVSDDEIAEAIRCYYRCTHNVAEGAGAAPLAALLQERHEMADCKVGVILCGGNIDTDILTVVLAGGTPQVA
ncbi:threonine dehydratase [Allohahella sp. A8]|uniref:threonine dehydratase n=1 Tax=Allohahella sp. A8 TaxID=3141461 RepID=UPI003A80CBF0